MKTQIEIELESYQYGKQNMARIIEANEAKGRAHSNPYAQAIYRRFVLPLAEIIREDVQPHGKAGRRMGHVALLRPLDPEAVAFLAVRATLSTMMEAGEDDTGRGVVAAVGRAVYHEYVLDTFADIEPDLFYRLVNDFERRQSQNERHKMTVFKLQAKKAGIDFLEWSSADRDVVGAYLLETLQCLGMVECRQVTIPNARPNLIRTKVVVTLTEETCELINQIKGFVIETSSHFRPCVEPPKDWVTIDDGGFHTKELRRMMPFMVKAHPSQRDHYLQADMSKEIAAVNMLQRVAWRINTKLYEAVRLVSEHFDMEEIISHAESPKPPKPEWLTPGMEKEEMDEYQLQEFIQWKRAVAEWHTEQKLRGTRWGRYSTAMRVATDFKDYPTIYFVYFVDFRGRKYVQTTGVSPQGSDLQKALLEFAEGKPLDTPEAVKWFKITGANRWGFDKATLEDRQTWVDSRKDLLCSYAADPVSNHGWTEADAPLQFLAWCMEYSEWCRSPSTFSSHLAVGMDGSCNGLQNFSAMLRDSVGGRATNLVPSLLPNDIYAMVAEVTTRLLSAADEDDNGYRRRWLAHGINRTMVKRSVMTLPYGSTRFSCAEFITSDYLRSGHVPEFKKEEYQRAANYLSHFVWRAIAEVVVKAREAMEWLQQSARQLIKGGEDNVSWVTPSGFPVMQMYWEQDVYQVSTKLCGGARIKLHRDNDTPAMGRHKNGIAPNFVHSLDASHLTMTALACEAEGIDSLWMVHDDYGTHAADAERMFHIIREQFVAMYEDHDPLQELQLAYPQLPPPPDKGELDIRQVLDSTFFFV